MRMFNITPKPRMLIGVQNQKWNISGALAELVDNSLGAGRGNASAVKIIYDTTDRTLTVMDNGRGMEYIGRLFQLGNTIGHTAGDIGHFGMGGTQAIIWLPEWVLVTTQRDGMIMHDRIRWSDIFEMEDFKDVGVSNEWKPGALSALIEGHGTVIYLKLLKERRIHVSNVMRDLSRLFAPGLRRGKQIIWSQMRSGELLEEHLLTDPFEIAAKPENCVTFNVVIEAGDVHLPVRGVISFDEKVSHADSVIRIGFGYREILRTRDCFKSDNEAFAGIGVSGWLDLGDGWQPYLTTTKDAIHDTPLYETLMDHVFKEIRTLLVLAEQQTVDFELDNIAVGLEMALEKTLQMKVKVEREGGRKNPDPDPPGPPGPKPEPPERNTGGVAHIRLIKQADDNMMGALARSGDDMLGIYVDINTEHTFVREAIRQKPVNAAALNLMIVSEIAVLLTEKAELANKALTRSMRDQLSSCDGQERVRMLVRYMMDNIPDKQMLKEAAE